MTNILYGVHGTGHGHAIRALTIASHFPQHNFLFISDDDGYEILNPEFEVYRLPAYASPVYRHKIQVRRMITGYLKMNLNGDSYKKKALRLVDSFQPDVAITDYEPNIPWISKSSNIPCLSVDHQHIVYHGCHSLPWNKGFGLLNMRAAIALQFHQIHHHMVISFFDTPIKPHSSAKVFPPIFRKDIIGRAPCEKDHVLAYHGYSTTPEFHDFLTTIKHPVRCYGRNIDEYVDNVTYRKNSKDNFLDDLASCRYVVSSAGHTLLSEALFYGKPVMAFPIRSAFEQFLNGHYLEKNGYGLVNDAFQPSAEILDVFEQNQEVYKKNINGNSFCGNESVFSTLDHYFNTKQYVT